LLAAVNYTDDDKNSALRRAADRGHGKIIEILMESGADPLANNCAALRAAEYQKTLAPRAYTNPAPWREAADILCKAGDKALADLRQRAAMSHPHPSSMQG
jgi:ankyrin repeat protein